VHANNALGDVPHRVLLGETQRTVLGCPDTIIDLFRGVGIVEEVIGKGNPRIDERHRFAKRFRRSVDLFANR